MDSKHWILSKDHFKTHLRFQASHLTMIVAKEGPPHQKIKKNKVVLKCFLGIIIPHLNGIFHFF